MKVIRRGKSRSRCACWDCSGSGAVVLTNAAGAIQEAGLPVGQLVLLSDHINLMGWNPLTGPNEPRFAVSAGAGQRFLDMSTAYSYDLRKLAREAAHDEGILALEEGVYLLCHAGTKL